MIEISSLPQVATWIAVVGGALIALRFLASIVAKVVTVVIAASVVMWLAAGADGTVLTAWWETLVSMRPPSPWTP